MKEAELHLTDYQPKTFLVGKPKPNILKVQYEVYTLGIDEMTFSDQKQVSHEKIIVGEKKPQKNININRYVLRKHIYPLEVEHIYGRSLGTIEQYKNK